MRPAGSSGSEIRDPDRRTAPRGTPAASWPASDVPGLARAALPALEDRSYRSRRENRPMALVARLGDDFSFLPFDRTDLEHNHHHARSRYGRVNPDEEPEKVSLFTFTERGIYRPGDDVHVGLIAKRYQGGKFPVR